MISLVTFCEKTSIYKLLDEFTEEVKLDSVDMAETICQYLRNGDIVIVTRVDKYTGELYIGRVATDLDNVVIHYSFKELDNGVLRVEHIQSGNPETSVYEARFGLATVRRVTKEGQLLYELNGGRTKFD